MMETEKYEENKCSLCVCVSVCSCVCVCVCVCCNQKRIYQMYSKFK